MILNGYRRDLMTERSREFLHGLEEYCNYKQEYEIAEDIKKMNSLLYNDDPKTAIIKYFLPTELHNILDAEFTDIELLLYILKSEGENTRYFRFIKDYIKKNKDLKILSDALSRSQIKSKVWLVDELSKINSHYENIVLLAGWYGQLIELFGDNKDKIKFKKFRNIELDRDACYESDYNFNLRRLQDYKVKSVHADINNLTLHSTGYEWEVENFKTNEKFTEKFLPDLIINTSAEHMTTEWFNQIRFKPWEKKPIVVIQSNNFFDIEEHINCVHSINHMKIMFRMEEILFEGELQLKGYKRFMLIGRP